MQADIQDVVATISPFLGLVGGYMGYRLAEGAAGRKEAREVRREVYRRTLHFITTLGSRADDGTRAEDSNAFTAALIREVQQLRSDMELDGSKQVQRAYVALGEKLSSDEFVEVVNAAHDANVKRARDRRAEAEEAKARGEEPPHRIPVPRQVEFERRLKDFVAPERDALIEAMRKDLNPRQRWDRG